MIHERVAYGASGGVRVVLLLLLLLAVGAAVSALVVALHSRTATGALASPANGAARVTEAVRILDERYARGEIDDEEYQHRRSVLGAP
jgi:putative membrane protein